MRNGSGSEATTAAIVIADPSKDDNIQLSQRPHRPAFLTAAEHRQLTFNVG
jgi:hypothetical protein